MNDALLWALLALTAAALVTVRARPRWLHRRAREKLLEPLAGVAAKYGGDVVEQRHVAFARTPRFTLAFVPDREGALEPGVPHHVRCEAPFQSPEFLEVWPRGSRFAPMRLTIAHEATLGAAEFERHFMVRADDTGFARGVLTAEIRDRITRLWGIGGRGLVRVDLYPHKLAVQKEEALAAPHLMTFVEKVLELRGELETSVREQEGVQWLDAPPRETKATCPICGSSAAEGEWVTCLKCRTAHHRECWEYNGGCSMFACGESRFELT